MSGVRRLDQTYRHGKGPLDKPCGDCFRTCLAVLLDVPSPAFVPHFTELSMGAPSKGGWLVLAWAREWLRTEHDLDLVSVEPDGFPRPDLPLIADVPKASHYVVMSLDGSVYHDPNPDRRDDPPFTVADVGEWLSLCAPYDPAPIPQLEAWRRADGSGWPEQVQVMTAYATSPAVPNEEGARP